MYSSLIVIVLVASTSVHCGLLHGGIAAQNIRTIFSGATGGGQQGNSFSTAHFSRIIAAPGGTYGSINPGFNGNQGGNQGSNLQSNGYFQGNLQPYGANNNNNGQGGSTGYSYGYNVNNNNNGYSNGNYGQGGNGY